MSTRQEREQAREAWVAQHAGANTKALLRRIVADGPIGTQPGVVTHGRRMTAATATRILHLVNGSGVATSDGRRYLADLLRHALGYETVAVQPAGLVNLVELDFIRRRARELLDQHHHELPPIIHELKDPAHAR